MPAVNFHKRELGSGVFTTSDISVILNQPRRKIWRYIKQYGDAQFGQKLFNQNYSWEVDGAIVVNFYALIELSFFFRLRDKYGLSIEKINKAREAMVSSLKTPYPFATHGVLTDKKEIFYKIEGFLVDANRTHQINIKEVVAPLLEKIDFENDKAVRYWPLGRNNSVVVDPRHQYGQPVIDGTNICTETLWEMVESGEKKKNIMVLYDLTQKQLNDALIFYKSAA